MRLKIAEVARAKRGKNMRQIADDLGVEHQTVMYWNQGRAHPRLLMICKILRLLNCTFEELLP